MSSCKGWLIFCPCSLVVTFSVFIELNTFTRSCFYQSCQIIAVFFSKIWSILPSTKKFATRENIFGPLISDKFERGIIFEVIVIDTIKLTGQCRLEDFMTLTIFFKSVNSIIKKRPARIDVEGLSDGANRIVDHWIFIASFH